MDGAAMRLFGAPAASEGRPLPPLGPLGSLVLPLPPALRLLLPTMPTPTQAADILSRAESLRAVATPAPKRVCHMCGVEKLAAKCRTALSDKLIKTFSAALVNSSEACALEPYVECGAYICKSCYDSTVDARTVCDALSPVRLPPQLLECDSEIKKLKRKAAAMSARALSTKMRADGSGSVVERVRQKRRDSLAERRRTLARRESFAEGGGAMLDEVTSPSHVHATQNVCWLQRILCVAAMSDDQEDTPVGWKTNPVGCTSRMFLARVDYICGVASCVKWPVLAAVAWS